ncbi:hypothetical protein F9U64_15870 [Gracilibacillus oryzae]|uniref:Uncharacterized protein n=1 Tax=Gracilibacillus oryzae TaxID=1672701 RepID=A0A7C8GRH4_9BACI|nr:hypothetical protein [Gracilibacillus oryzae]KAB8128606.1 hypothetical protein F9U64_15870 [Gracilibacillus oryzae]
MNAERKEIILKEIRYWKSHQLLPVHYCDFLIALYTEGEGENESSEEQEAKNTPYYLFYYFFNTFLLLIPLLLYVTVENDIWKIIPAIIVLLLNIWMIRLFKKHDRLNEDYAVMILFVNFLFSSSLLLNEWFHVNWITYLWIYINSLSWIVFGKWKKQLFVQIAGVFVFIIACILSGFYYF